METTTELYTVKSGLFEGPLDLLLSLIENRKLFVNEISLAEVTNDYITHTRSLPALNMADVSSFIVIAAALILIKSRSLLPNLELSTDEEEKIIDLEKRLKLYQMIKGAGQNIKIMFGENPMYMSDFHLDSIPVWSPDQKITQTSMLEAVKEVLARIPKKDVLAEVTVRKVISLEEMIDSLTERIESSMKMSFSSFAKQNGGNGDTKEQKVYVIVSFLAMLELVRQGIVDVIQQGNFEEMEMTKTQ